VGIPIKIDKQPWDKSMLSYARLLVEVDLPRSFPEEVDLINENGLLIRQTVKHGWKSVKCTNC